MRNFRDYISEESLVSAAKARPVTGFIDGKQFIVQGKDKTWRFAIVSMSTDLSKQSNAIRDSLMAWATVTDNAGSKWQLYMRKNGSFRLWGKNGSTIGPTVEGRFRKESIRQGMTEGSHDFKDFKDPWAVMSPEDRREANRLTMLIMKVMPSSPRQKELQAKRNAILAKYKIGQKNESITEAASIKWMKPEPIKVQGPNGKYYARSKGEYAIKSQDGRFTIKKIAGYGGGFIYQLFDRKRPDSPWLNLDSIQDAKDQAEDQL